jgi:predicted XRE-type DNA-binding protein
MAAKNDSEKLNITQGHQNVFMDLNFTEEEANSLWMKSRFFNFLQKAVDKELTRCTQAQLAKKLGVSQPLVSKIVNDDFSIFSVERIAHLLFKLNYDIFIDFKPKAKSKKFIK